MENLLHVYSQLVTIRAFEEKLGELFSKGLLGGTSHFCIGQESSAVGVIDALRPTDWLISNHRCHGHLLARGLEPERLFGELLGRINGYCGGRGGSQHTCSIEHCVLGTNGIVGGGLPMAAGAAAALKYKGRSDIAVVFFGDGASNQGTFHETLNMAALWKLPVLFVCENNLYGMSTPVSKTIAGGTDRVAPRAAIYGIPAATADAHDIEALFKTAYAAAESVRSGNGPFLLEVMTYRLCGHSKSEPRIYRTREEESAQAECDVLRTFPARLLQCGFSQEEIDRTRTTAQTAIDHAAEIALAQPSADKTKTLSGVYAP